MCLHVATRPARATPTPPVPSRDALVPLDRRAPPDALDTLRAFRMAVYAAFGARRDALFELLDALLTAEPVVSPVHLSLAPAHRRGHGSFSAAVNGGPIDAAAVEALLTTAATLCPLTEHPAAPPLYGVDTSVWPRCDAETSPERGFYHHASRHSAGKPILRLRSGPPAGRSSGSPSSV